MMADFDEIKARVTIRDILAHAVIPAGKNRIPCSIHGGSNPNASSFTDYGFYCFACGTGGGLIDLVEYLYHYDRKEAVRYLCRLAGVPFVEPKKKRAKAEQAGKPFVPPKLSPLDSNEAYCKAKHRLEWFELHRDCLDRALYLIRRNLAAGKMPCAWFYAKEQCCLYELEELDWLTPSAKYQMNQIRRRLLDDRDSGKDCKAWVRFDSRN